MSCFNYGGHGLMWRPLFAQDVRKRYILGNIIKQDTRIILLWPVGGFYWPNISVCLKRLIDDPEFISHEKIMKMIEDLKELCDGT